MNLEFVGRWGVLEDVVSMLYRKVDGCCLFWCVWLGCSRKFWCFRNNLPKY